MKDSHYVVGVKVPPDITVRLQKLFTDSFAYLRSGHRWILPFVVCTLWMSLATPMVWNNLDDVGLIAWFSHDEIYMLDLLQFYLKGVYDPDTFQGSQDYGFHLRYVAFFLKLLGFENVDPGVGLGIIRLQSLMFGLLAIVIFWKLLVRHLGGDLSSTVALLGLALCPSFVWLLDFAKPDPIVLCLNLLSLDCALRIIGSPRKHYLIAAVALAALSSGIKYMGLFVLPGILVAAWRERDYFAGWKAPGLLFATLGAGWFLVSPVLASAFLELSADYAGKHRLAEWVVQSSGLVTLLWMMPSLVFLGCAVVYVLASRRAVRTSSGFWQATSLSLGVASLFLACLACFGMIWYWHPKSALFNYASLFTLHQQGGFQYQSFFSILASTGEIIFRNLTTLTGVYLYDWYHPEQARLYVMSDLLGIGGLLALGAYFAVQLPAMRRTIRNGTDLEYKRFTILVASLSFLAPMLVYGNVRANHFVQPIGLLFLLAAYGAFGFPLYDQHKTLSESLKWIIVTALLITLALNAKTSLEWRINKLGQRPGSQDLVWEMQRWWRDNVPPDTAIVAGHPSNVYLPPEFRNVGHFPDSVNKNKGINWSVSQLRNQVHRIHPSYIAYNRGAADEDEVLPEIGELLPEGRFVAVKTFEGRRFRRLITRDDRIVVYKVLQLPMPVTESRT